MKGSDITVKKGTVAAGTLIAAGRTVSCKINAQPVDITSADDTARWRLLLAAAGTKSMEVSMSGVLKDVSTAGAMITDSIAQSIDAYGITLATLGSFDGSFQLTDFEANGEYNGEAQYSMTLMSSGTITYSNIA